MSLKFSQSYLNALFSSPDTSKLVKLFVCLQWADGYSRDEPNYGYPQPVFVFVESLTWFAQAIRSGVCTYYEATPWARQHAMLCALESEAPSGLSTHYSLGMRNWRNRVKIRVVDIWIRAHEEDNNRWLWRLVNEHRPEIERLCGHSAPVRGRLN